ncbi:MAG: cation transporter [Bacilli bacterium]|nr:cation transporter [Bacilli bacterium]
MKNKYKNIKIASILGMIFNIILAIMKGIVGFFTMSQAMIADFYNSFSDVFSSLMTFIGNHISSKPRDKDHNLGHGKAEYIFSFVIALVSIQLGISIFRSSLFDNTIIKFSWLLIIVNIITIVVKTGLFIYTNRISKKYNNILMLANSLDHRNDVLVTSFNLLSSVLLYFGISYIDRIVGFGIGIWIIVQGVQILITSYNVLMDKSLDDSLKYEIINLVKSHKEVKRLNHFNATPIGYRYQISFTIFVDGNLTTFESHEIANHLEEEIHEKFKDIYLTVIHVNPV